MIYKANKFPVQMAKQRFLSASVGSMVAKIMLLLSASGPMWDNWAGCFFFSGREWRCNKKNNLVWFSLTASL
jgi:hypothetical protein